MTPKRLCKLLIQKNITVSTAESCTGGGISSRLVSFPGISQVFLGGIVAYTNRSKAALLGVPEAILEEYGAVSAECAAAMARGVLRRTGSMIAVSSTGFAGPGGGTEREPVGTVYLGIAVWNTTDAYRFSFSGDRRQVTEAAIQTALGLLLEAAEKY